ncbi:MAG: AraC family transcriptional regulator [Bacteroidetes bacterium]|jgi:AraC-like DNA-binding protein|nr:MAG: AraC family transcriptional regulator [Bacteroidota bacterium]TAF93435.1 MAG: AraC family transcriptional regulator [Bacteroidota bacterium]
MKHFHFHSSCYTEFLQQIGYMYGAPVVKNCVELPADVGEGYVWAKKLASGISLLVSNCKFHKEQIIKREPSHYPFYIFQFNECLQSISSDISFFVSKPYRSYNLQNNHVLLQHSMQAANYFIPANVRLRSVKLIVTPQVLESILPLQNLEQKITDYTAHIIRSKTIEPLDAEYRTIMDMMVHATPDMPFATKHLDNRVMLLLERFFCKNFSHIQQSTIVHEPKLLAKLMKIEAILVEDYSAPPPTIDVLAEVAGMSTTKLKKDFKDLYGLPIYEYFQRNRMIKARQMLNRNIYSIKEVGLQVGYTNLGHFAAAFKKEFNLLPSEILQKGEVLPVNAMVN